MLLKIGDGLKDFPKLLEKLDLKPEVKLRIESLMYAVPKRYDTLIVTISSCS